MGLFSSNDASQIARQLSRIERKLDAVLLHLKIDLPDDERSDVRELVDAGETIDAIKLLRKQTGMGLAEAKLEIERMADKTRSRP
jgi:hypothetical protein